MEERKEDNGRIEALKNKLEDRKGTCVNDDTGEKYINIYNRT